MTSVDLNTWFESINLEKLKTIYDLGEWSATFAIIVWWLWKWRNEAVFNKISWDVSQKVSWIKSQCREIGRAFNNALQPARRNRMSEVSLLSRVKPTPRWAKLNMDGCVRSDIGNAGGGCVLRDEEGTWIMGFTFNSGLY